MNQPLSEILQELLLSSPQSLAIPFLVTLVSLERIYEFSSFVCKIYLNWRQVQYMLYRKHDFCCFASCDF
jgi:hypothetical protein